MNFKLISILMVIFFLAVAGVSAVEENITDDNAFISNTDDVSNINSEILTASVDENNDEDYASSLESTENTTNESSELLSASVDENNSEDILSLDNEDSALSVENNDETLNAQQNRSNEVIASEPPSDVPVGDPTITHGSKLKLEKASNLGNMITKEGIFAKVKITKKDFKRFILKEPSKKNKKLWKKYKKFMKTFKKKYKKSKKVKIKALKKKWKIDWYYGVRMIFALKGKYCTVNFVCMLYKWI